MAKNDNKRYLKSKMSGRHASIRNLLKIALYKKNPTVAPSSVKKRTRPLLYA